MPNIADGKGGFKTVDDAQYEQWRAADGAIDVNSLDGGSSTSASAPASIPSGGMTGGGSATDAAMTGLQNAGPSGDMSESLSNLIAGPSPTLRQGIGQRSPSQLSTLAQAGLRNIY